jgi:hypothetical protein
MLLALSLRLLLIRLALLRNGIPGGAKRLVDLPLAPERGQRDASGLRCHQRAGPVAVGRKGALGPVLCRC